MSNDKFIPDNLYGNATGLYQDILEEIEAIPQDRLVVHLAKQVVMPAIAKVLQNKIVIAMDWEVANQQDGIYEFISHLFNRIADNILQEKSRKEKYAKFLQFFPEEEHEAVLTAIANKGTYNNDDSQRNFFLNKMNFFRILPVNDDNMTWNMSSDEEFLIDEVNIFASVIEGVPHINEQETENRINGYEFTEDTIDDQLTGYLDWASERCGTDLARYKKWAIENKQDPLGLLNNVLPLQ